MLILALESSAKAASVALCRDGVLIAQSQQCSGLTHSCTLLPMAEQMLKNTDTRLADVDAIAVARGPGSFTGVRIGVSTAKGPDLQRPVRDPGRKTGAALWRPCDFARGAGRRTGKNAEIRFSGWRRRTVVL